MGGIDSGPAMGVVAGSTIPSYCIMSPRGHIASQLERTGEAMRIHVSSESKTLLDKVGGFRCEPRGTIHLGVTKSWSYGHFLADWTIRGHRRQSTRIKLCSDCGSCQDQGGLASRKPTHLIVQKGCKNCAD